VGSRWGGGSWRCSGGSCHHSYVHATQPAQPAFRQAALPALPRQAQQRSTQKPPERSRNLRNKVRPLLASVLHLLVSTGIVRTCRPWPSRWRSRQKLGTTLQLASPAARTRSGHIVLPFLYGSRARETDETRRSFFGLIALSFQPGMAHKGNTRKPTLFWARFQVLLSDGNRSEALYRSTFALAHHHQWV
jgi:hypothetical protein